MSNIYVRSTDGSNADNGSTWALAKASIGGAAAIDAAGDTIFFSQAHSESFAGATVAIAGTQASPSKLICGNDAVEPPTAVATTASFTQSDNTSFGVSGWFYAYGLKWNIGLDNSCVMTLSSNSNDRQVWEKCQFIFATTVGNFSRLQTCGGSNAQKTVWKNCDIKFAQAVQRIDARGTFIWQGGSVLAGSASDTTALIEQSGARGGRFLVEGVDLSNLPAAVNLVNTTGTPGSVNNGVFRNCKLPASWSGALQTGGMGSAPGCRYEMYNCDSADTNYRLWVEDYAGSIKQETTLVKTGGASDGTTPIAWKMTSGADAEYPHQTLRSPEIVQWNETTGSAITVTIDILHDSATNLKDDEVWLEVQYLGTSGVPLGSFVSDAKADVLATAADQTASGATWTTTAMANPNKQKLSVTFTPQEKGFIHAVVHLAKASKTVYVDPLLQVS